ncbi:MAG: twin transmembrane helix small protein [Pseudomonadota bacterium]
MQTLLFHLTTIASLAVLVALVYGLWTMLKGDNANLSQKLMRWRVGLQFLAIVAVMGFALLTRA